MRRGHFNYQWIEDDEHKFIGVSFGSDYCAEHEWGIADIRAGFGMPKSMVETKMFGLKKVFGIETRTIRSNKAVYFEEDGMFLIGYTTGNPSYLTSFFKSEKTYVASHDFIGLWSDRGFVLISKDEAKMKDLWAAFERLDLTIFTGGSTLFSNGGGLNLCIISRMPTNVLDDMRESDMNAYELRKTADALGIEERLKKAGCKYYALSPKWEDKQKKLVKFWLNPQDQKNHNSGWYSVEELDQWIKGEGPIIMQLEKSKK